MTQTLAAPGTRSANRAVAYLVGGGYLAAGVVGGSITLGAAFAPGGEEATGLGVGWVAVYLFVGVALLTAAARGRARQANTLLGAAYLLASVPLLAAGVCSAPFELNHPDGLLHLSSAALLLGFGRTQD